LQQNRVACECAEWIKEKVDVRSVIYPNFLHGKLYHIENNRVENAILGSSNFTVNGLGLSNSRNVELNLVVDGNRDREDLKTWFEHIWNDESIVQDVKDEVLRYLSEIYADYSPEFIYQKTLYHLFEGTVQESKEAERQQTQMLLSQTQIWNTLYGFQKVAVQSAIGKIQKHNGCIIADSVGLGKTFEALAVIKFFECRNQNVLVLCPKKLRENWTIYNSSAGNTLNPFPSDRFNFTVLSHTDLSRDNGISGSVDLANFHWDNYDLVVIDESHNFRNNAKGKRDVEGNIIRRSRYERLMQDIINKGVKTKVLLLSATPVNNDLKDLRNQIYLLTGNDDKAFQETIGVSSVQDTLAQTQRQFNDWANDNSNRRDRRSLLSKLNPAFFKLLDELTIARSRKHVEQYYSDSMESVGKFPKRLPPKSIHSEIDTKGRFMTYDRLNSINDSVQLVNFWATDDLNKYLNLKSRVEARMALVDVSTTSSDNILLPSEVERLAKNELNYRDKQLLRLKDEILDLEDFNESIALNDFSLDDFRAELSELFDADRKKLRDAPFGIYAVTPTKDDNPSGVIFCLQQQEAIGQSEKINPLQPFYLVYVRNDGVMFYSFLQAKQMLETFRFLCRGSDKPFEELCRQFNQETNDGENMSFYDGLLQTALSEIKQNFQQRNTGNLFAGRSGALVNYQEDLFESSNFKLITWLVIK